MLLIKGDSQISVWLAKILFYMKLSKTSWVSYETLQRDEGGFGANHLIQDDQNELE